MSSGSGLFGAAPPYERMVEMARRLDVAAKAAAVIMHGGALVILMGQAFRNVIVVGGALGLSSSYMISFLVSALFAAFWFWLRLGFVWFFLRYFAYVMETRAEALRAAETNPLAGEHEPAPQ